MDHVFLVVVDHVFLVAVDNVFLVAVDNVFLHIFSPEHTLSHHKGKISCLFRDPHKTHRFHVLAV